MLKEIDVTVDEQNYTIYQFPGGEGFELTLEIGRTVGPLLTPLFAAVGGEGFTTEAATSISTALSQHLQPKDFLALVRRLFRVVHANGNGLDIPGVGALTDGKFDNHFAGKQGTILKLLRVVLEHNFSDFMAALIEEMGKMKAVTKAGE
jgi:hypothetical protein